MVTNDNKKKESDVTVNDKKKRCQALKSGEKTQNT